MLHDEDITYLRDIEIEGMKYVLNKYLKVKTHKRLLAKKNDLGNQFPELYDVDDGTYFENDIELRIIGKKMLCIWTITSDKIYKISIEGSLVAKIKVNRQANMNEVI
jgi:hypothetical protein